MDRPVRLTKRGGESLSRNEIGNLGERIAARFLRKEGRRILGKNYRAPHGGEVDLVCRDGKVLTFVEVKTRTSRKYGRPLDAVNREKQRLIERGANDWLKRLPTRQIPIRYDVVELILEEGHRPDVRVVHDAF